MFPKGEPRLESAVVPSGEDAIFACKMRSLKNERPPTAPVWRRNGELLPQNQSKYTGSITDLLVS